MRYLVLCVTLNILFFINTVYSLKIESAKYDNADKLSVNFNTRQTLQLSCNVSDDKNSSGEVKWRKNNEVLKENSRISFSNKGNTYKMTIDEARETDAGNYSCVVMDGEKRVTSERLIRAMSNLKVKVPTNINVIEGEKLKIHCLVRGLPLPEMSWEYRNETYNATFQYSSDRVKLEDDPDRDIDNSILIVDEVFLYDRGVFTCIATSPITGQEMDRAECMVRIKDKYAALWPFLGICAEVITLCAIIFIYEKKRNKTELEESDTDQSPDQKNTPDNGKDSNLRHRQ